MKGQLRAPGVLEQQVERMLADPRAEALATRFASQWLRLQDLDKIHPDALLYPAVRSLRWPRRCGARPSCSSTRSIREDRSVLDLLTADYTFVNERLARHYGIPNVTGPAFRRVALDRREPPRAARPRQHPDDDVGRRPHVAGAARQVGDGSAARRRRRHRRRPTCPTLEETKGVADARLLSVRERMEQHRANPQCTSCHRVIDPLGLALENFDVTGQWRIKDNGVADRPVRHALRRHADRRAGRVARRRC